MPPTPDAFAARIEETRKSVSVQLFLTAAAMELSPKDCAAFLAAVLTMVIQDIDGFDPRAAHTVRQLIKEHA